MAANSSYRGVASIGKRFLTHSPSTLSPRSLSSPAFRRSVHNSVYDKNVEDNVRPAVVPDDLTQAASEKCWAPNPNNGVFGPPGTKHNPGSRASANAGGSESVLEVKTFFRSLEDLEKPQHP